MITIYNSLFFLFSFNTLFSASAVILSRNTIHSVFFLIAVFFNATALLLLLKIEFISLILVIVYVGAVAVLFLFVVMMLNINLIKYDDSYIFVKRFQNSKTAYKEYLTVKKIIGTLCFVFFINFIYISLPVTDQSLMLTLNGISLLSNVHALGVLLYIEHVVPFMITAMILLVAMIGAIILTLTTERNVVKHQSIVRQINRDFADAVFTR